MTEKCSGSAGRAKSERLEARLHELDIKPEHVENLRRAVYHEVSFWNLNRDPQEAAQRIACAKVAFDQAMFQSDSPPDWVEAARKAAGL